MARNVEFNKIDNNTKSKLIAAPSAGNLFDSNMKRNPNKIIYKNITRKTSEISNSNDSIKIKNDLVKKNYSTVNNSEYMMKSINKGKLVSKISRQQSYKN